MTIGFDAFELQWMAGNILTHNHPTGGRFPRDDPRSAGYSFSPADIALFVSSRLTELRAVSRRYTYSVKPPNALDVNPGAQAFRDHIQRLTYGHVFEVVTDHSYWIERALARQAADPNDPLTVAEAEVILHQLVMVELAKSWGLRYVREEVRES